MLSPRDVLLFFSAQWTAPCGQKMEIICFFKLTVIMYGKLLSPPQDIYEELGLKGDSTLRKITWKYIKFVYGVYRLRKTWMLSSQNSVTLV